MDPHAAAGLSSMTVAKPLTDSRKHGWMHNAENIYYLKNMFVFSISVLDFNYHH